MNKRLSSFDSLTSFIRKSCWEKGSEIKCGNTISFLNSVSFCSYRMAPDFAYPTPVNECYKATLYALKHFEEFGVDPKKLVLAGDSAGKRIV